MEARESMEFWLTVSTLGLQTHPVVISPIPKDVVKTDIFGSWINASVPNLWRKSYHSEERPAETSKTAFLG